MNAINNPYLWKALDFYPHDLAETMEALNYALSWDEECPVALGLLGTVYFEQFYQPEKAIACFQKALVSDPDCLEIYPKLIAVYLYTSEFDSASKTLKYAKKMRGADLGYLLILEAELYERKGKYKKALRTLKLSKLNTFYNGSEHFLQSMERRIKNKIPKI